MTKEFPYLEERVESQRKWHSNKATYNKKRYYWGEIISIIAGALIPIINVFNIVPDDWIRILSTVLASIIVIVSGVGKLVKYQENWLNYRAVAEALKREREFYTYEVGEYDTRSTQKREKMLVQRVENIISGSTTQFLSMHGAENEGEQGAATTETPPEPNTL